MLQAPFARVTTANHESHFSEEWYPKHEGQGDDPSLESRKDFIPTGTVRANPNGTKPYYSMRVVTHQIVLFGIQLAGLDQLDGEVSRYVVESREFPQPPASKTK